MFLGISFLCKGGAAVADQKEIASCYLLQVVCWGNKPLLG